MFTTMNTLRNVLLVATVSALVLGPVTSAEAKSKSRKFSVSAHADNKTMDLDSGSGDNRTTKILGRVKGGPVKGKKVIIYTTNLNGDHTRRYLGSVKLSKKGKFSTTFKPTLGGTYRVEIIKKGGGGRKAVTRTITVRAFEWPILSRFFDPSASTQTGRADREQTGQGRDHNARWSTAYVIGNGGQATFNLQGYNCWRFNMKLAVSQTSAAPTGTAVVSQGTHVITTQTLQRGGGYWEPSRALSETLDPNLPLVVTVSGADADAGPLRMIMGLPKASCTIPDNGPR